MVERQMNYPAFAPPRLFAFRDEHGCTRLGFSHSESEARLLPEGMTVTELAERAWRSGGTLAAAAEACVTAVEASPHEALEKGRLSPVVQHPDPYRMMLSGTGLTHIGSADLRRAFHAHEPRTDSDRMFQAGVERGRPAGGEIGAEPEWFFKGLGCELVGPGDPVHVPLHAASVGEEAELAGAYWIAPDGEPRRLGFLLVNDVSDHCAEQRNYMYIASSKLRPFPIGAELLLGSLPAEVDGTVRVVRDGSTFWRSSFASGEARMTHSIANLEHHHFKHAIARRPGDLHVHMFGCDTTSGKAAIEVKDGDTVEIQASAFRLPLVNMIVRKASGTEVWRTVPL
jgi:hypothetical protein